MYNKKQKEKVRNKQVDNISVLVLLIINGTLIAGMLIGWLLTILK